MIVIIAAGSILTAGGRVSGPEIAMALAAVRAGGAVELVARLPEGGLGDGAITQLARGGIGHAAVLRVSPASRDAGAANAGNAASGAANAGPSAGALDAADVDLALRYLPEIRVIVTAVLDPALLAAVGAAAVFHGAHLVVVAPASRSRDADQIIAAAQVPDAQVTVLGRPSGPPGALDDLVGAFAAALDRGRDPERAFAEARGSVPADAVGD